MERHTPGGGRTNQQHFGPRISTSAPGDVRRIQLLYDPQTSGGLLAAVAAESADAAVRAFAAAGVSAWPIGAVAPTSAVAVSVRAMV